MSTPYILAEGCGRTQHAAEPLSHAQLESQAELSSCGVATPLEFFFEKQLRVVV